MSEEHLDARQLRAVLVPEEESALCAQAQRCDVGVAAELRFVVTMPAHAVVAVAIKVRQDAVEGTARGVLHELANLAEGTRPRQGAEPQTGIPILACRVAVPGGEPGRRGPRARRFAPRGVPSAERSAALPANDRRNQLPRSWASAAASRLAARCLLPQVWRFRPWVMHSSLFGSLGGVARVDDPQRADRLGISRELGCSRHELIELLIVEGSVERREVVGDTKARGVDVGRLEVVGAGSVNRIVDSLFRPRLSRCATQSR
jgi:hypothetical protein